MLTPFSLREFREKLKKITSIIIYKNRIPERLQDRWNEFFDYQTEELVKFKEGFVKLVSDSDLSDEDKYELTSLWYNPKGKNHFNKEFLRDFDIGIGIATGPVMRGNIGNSLKMDDTVIGDTVNLSSRIEGLTKTYRTQIMIDDNLYNILQDEGLLSKYHIRRVDQIIAKGTNKARYIYEIYDSANQQVKDLKKKSEGDFDRAMEIYLKPVTDYLMEGKSLDDVVSAWREAQRIFRKVNSLFTDELPKDKLIVDKELKRKTKNVEMIGDNVSYYLAKRIDEQIENKEYEGWPGYYEFMSEEIVPFLVEIQ